MTQKINFKRARDSIEVYIGRCTYKIRYAQCDGIYVAAEITTQSRGSGAAAVDYIHAPEKLRSGSVISSPPAPLAPEDIIMRVCVRIRFIFVKVLYT